MKPIMPWAREWQNAALRNMLHLKQNLFLPGYLAENPIKRALSGYAVAFTESYINNYWLVME